MPPRMKLTPSEEPPRDLRNSRWSAGTPTAAVRVVIFSFSDGEFCRTMMLAGCGQVMPNMSMSIMPSTVKLSNPSVLAVEPSSSPLTKAGDPVDEGVRADEALLFLVEFEEQEAARRVDVGVGRGEREDVRRAGAVVV